MKTLFNRLSISLSILVCIFSCQDPNADATARNGTWELSDYGYSTSFASQHNQPATRSAYISQYGCLSALITINTNNTVTIANQCNHNAGSATDVNNAYSNRSIDYETMGAIPQGEDTRFYFVSSNTQVLLNRQPTNQAAYARYYRVYFSSDKQFMYWLTGENDQNGNDVTITWHKVCPSGGCY